MVSSARPRRPYRWRHNWIPRTPGAALAKAKGSPTVAAKLRARHHINATPKTKGVRQPDSSRRVAGVPPRQQAAMADRLKAKRAAALPPDLIKDLRGGSADKHLVTDSTGTHFTAERLALHAEITERIVGGHRSQANPSFVMLGGGPASGKTKAAEAAARDFPDAVTINPDDIKAMLPEYAQQGPERAASFTHEESSYLAKRVTAAAIAKRTHIVLDAVGDNSAASVEGKVAAARAAGYSTHARYVTVPIHVAQTRAVLRGQRSGRVVPPTVIAHAHSGVSAVFPKVMDQFDTASLHDNTTDWKPVLSMKRGQSPTIHDPAAYSAFLSKAG